MCPGASAYRAVQRPSGQYTHEDQEKDSICVVSGEAINVWKVRTRDWYVIQEKKYKIHGYKKYVWKVLVRTHDVLFACWVVLFVDPTLM